MTIAAPPMPVATPPAPVPQAAPVYVPPTPYLLTSEQFRNAARAGVFGKDRVELIEGVPVKKMTINEPHMQAVSALDYLLRPILPAGWTIRVQGPIAPDPNSCPEPDICVVRGTYHTYNILGRPPEPAEIGLLVEVADSSLADDRHVKGRVYARANVVEYWIVNIPDRLVEVYTDPAPNAPIPAYRSRHDFAPGYEIPVRLDNSRSRPYPRRPRCSSDRGGRYP